jgi:N-succinyl-L-ornithine transcarbamylase
MKQFLSVKDTDNVHLLVEHALRCKYGTASDIGKGKTLGLVFMNPSLRTRMSSQRAAQNIGMNVIVLNVNEDGWKIEWEDGAVMNEGSQEHIKDAAKVMGSYCDILGVRSFATLTDRERDYDETVMQAFVDHAGVPIISLESATRHPLQPLADLTTISESGIKKPKVVVSWANHPRTLPQAVTNSFLEWISKTEANVVLTHPKGYELSEEFTNGIVVTNNQMEALQDADFVYTKNWSSYQNYGETPEVKDDWMITSEKMASTNSGKFMHCLPIRRNVIASDEVIDHSLVYEQAENRIYAAQAVLIEILKGN